MNTLMQQYLILRSMLTEKAEDETAGDDRGDREGVGARRQQRARQRAEIGIATQAGLDRRVRRRALRQPGLQRCPHGAAGHEVGDRLDRR